MKIMLDLSPKRIAELSEKYDHEFWQLRTPLTKYKIAGVPYGLDNGCFTKFDEPTWLRLIQEARESEAEIKFVTLPDIVGDATRTLDLFEEYRFKTQFLPRALVLQDGIGQHRIDWHKIDAVFVGGSDSFKISQEAMNCAKVAKMLGKWVHVGRVNTAHRLKDWLDLADSIDGSGICRYDHMLEKMMMFLKKGDDQITMFDENCA